jgi:hypothetical protein
MPSVVQSGMSTRNAGGCASPTSARNFRNSVAISVYEGKICSKYVSARPFACITLNTT